MIRKLAQPQPTSHALLSRFLTLSAVMEGAMDPPATTHLTLSAVMGEAVDPAATRHLTLSAVIERAIYPTL